MKAVDYKVDVGGGATMKFHVEHFKSFSEVYNVCTKRECKYSGHSGIDYFNLNARGLEYGKNKGFSSQEELFSKLRTGYNDTDVLKDVHKFVHLTNAPEIKKYKGVRRDVCGGGVDIPRYLTGSPDCMLMPYKQMSDSNIVHIGMISGVPWHVSPEAIKAAGKALARSIYSLEKAGYRVTFDVLAAHRSIPNPYYGSGMTIRIKNSDGALSLPKLLYPLCDVSFMRGISFGQVVQDPHLGYAEGLSYPIREAFPSSRKVELTDKMCAQVFGKDAMCFDINTILDIYDRDREHAPEAMEKFILSRLALDGGSNGRR